MGRVISYPEKTGVEEGDFILMDSGTAGTKKIKPSNLVKIDKTLSVDGSAADAVETGLRFGDDIIKSIPAYLSGAYYSLNSSVTAVNVNTPDGSNSSYECAKTECQSGDVFYYTGTGGSGARCFAFLSSASGDNNIISRAINGDARENEKIVAPEGAVYAIFNWNKNYPHLVTKGETVSEKISAVNARVDNDKKTIVVKGNPLVIPEKAQNVTFDMKDATTARMAKMTKSVITRQAVADRYDYRLSNSKDGFVTITGTVRGSLATYWGDGGFTEAKANAKPTVHGTGQTIKISAIMCVTKLDASDAKLSVVLHDIAGNSARTIVQKPFGTTRITSGAVDVTLEDGKDYALAIISSFSGLSDGDDIGVTRIWVGISDTDETAYTGYAASAFDTMLPYEDGTLVFSDATTPIEASVETLDVSKNDYLVFRTIASEKRSCSNVLINPKTNEAIVFDLSDSTANDQVITLLSPYKIKAVVISHFHYDHIGIDYDNGAFSDGTIFERLKPLLTDDAVCYIQKPPTDNAGAMNLWNSATSLMTSAGIVYQIVPHELWNINIGDVRLTFVNVDYDKYADYLGDAYGAYNNSSLCTFVEYGHNKIFITGDIYYPAQQRLFDANVLTSAPVLLAPHHGLATKISNWFMDAIDPEVIVTNYGTSTDSSINTATMSRGYSSAIKAWSNRKPSVRLFDTYENHTFDIVIFKDGTINSSKLLTYVNPSTITDYSNVRDAVYEELDEDSASDAYASTRTLNVTLQQMRKNSSITHISWGSYQIFKDIFGDLGNNNLLACVKIRKLVGANSNNIFNRGAAVDIGENRDYDFVYHVHGITLEDTPREIEFVGRYKGSDHWTERYYLHSSTVEQVSGTSPTITARAGVRYICGEVTSLNFTPASTGICDVVFTSGSTPTVLTLPNTVIMPSWFVVEANTTYEINIADGVYGSVMSWT